MANSTVYHLASFLLGAALPTAFLFFLASDRLGQGLSSISLSWRTSSGTRQPADGPLALRRLVIKR